MLPETTAASTQMDGTTLTFVKNVVLKRETYFYKTEL